MQPQSVMQTITTYFARWLGGNARCLLPEPVNSKTSPCRSWQMQACPELYDRAFPAGVSGGKKRVGLRLLIQRLGC